MKHIDIIIPTRNRLRKLKKTLASIPGQLPLATLNVHLCFDNDRLGYNRFCDFQQVNDRNNITSMVLFAKDNGPNGAVACRNAMIGSLEKEDGILYATDDIIFKPGSIKNALKRFNAEFKDEDGVVGFHQEGNSYHPTGVALVGRKFLERYPDRQLFYPGYFHFACQEIFWLATKLEKFVLEHTAVISHFHPCNFKKYMDQTHRDARKYKKHDMDLKVKREAAGLIWGDS